MTLKEMREGLGYSQLAVEGITGVPQSTISRLEKNNTHTPREDLLIFAIMQKIVEYEAQKNGKNNI